MTTSQLDPIFPDQDIDLGIMIGRPSEAHVHYQYLFSPTMFPVCSPKLLSGRNRIKRPDDLSRFTMLQVYPSAGDWAAWLEATGAKGIDPDGGLRFDSYDHALRMAARGMGVSLAMQPYVERGFGGRLTDCPAASPYRAGTRGLVSRLPIEHRKLPKTMAFQSWLLEEISGDESLALLRHENHKE